MNFRQGHNELLGEFMIRFYKDTLLIRELSSAIALHAMLASLKQWPFADSSARKPPIDIDELRRRAIGYIIMEKVVVSRQDVQSKKDNSRLDDRPISNKQKHDSWLKANRNQRSDRRSRDNRNQKFDTYTPLNTPIEQILREVFHAELIELPRPGKTPTGADHTKHC